MNWVLIKLPTIEKLAAFAILTMLLCLTLVQTHFLVHELSHLGDNQTEQCEGFCTFTASSDGLSSDYLHHFVNVQSASAHTWIGDPLRDTVMGNHRARSPPLL